MNLDTVKALFKKRANEIATGAHDKTGVFDAYLSDKRIPVAPPEDIIDENGKAVFGTFDREFQKMSFTKIHKQSCLPDFTNPIRYTRWEATEVNFDDVLFLTAVCNMGIIGVALTLVYDKETEELLAWKEMMLPQWAVISETLLNKDETYSKGFMNKILYKNDFGNGKAYVSGNAKSKSGKVNYDLELTRVSLPSVVSIPFGENKPLYSQKDHFTVKGYLEVNGKRYEASKNTTAIIDDHRGYYPYNSHYDWVTTMGRRTFDGKEQYFAFNLTRNQSINQDDFNENLIWFEGETTRLTPVYFKHLEYNKWHITDDHGMVDVIFDIGDRYLMKLNIGIINMDYHITFGKISGYVCDPSGYKYDLDGMYGIGEDKSLRI